jgi:YegS/Rv2252/BmrU family lipid kinase
MTIAAGVPARPGLVLNPSKTDDVEQLCASIDAELAKHGVGAALRRETTEDEPGLSQTNSLLEDGVDLVISFGGDGTVRACAEALRGTGVPLALLTGGTGNLLARNLGIPADLAEAVSVAVRGERRALDIGSCNGHGFVVMAGIGFDAQMVRDAPESLKSRIGWLAYGVSGLRAVRRAPILQITLTFEDRQVIKTRGVGVLAANVGTLTGGMTLLPDAIPDDGVLDIAVLGPATMKDWITLGFQVVTGRVGQSRHLQTWPSESVVVQVDRPSATDADGDVQETTTELVVTVDRGALVVCVPSPSTQ